MRLISELVKDIFVDNNMGEFAGTTDWSIYLGNQPKEPSKVVTIYDTLGVKPEGFHNLLENPIEQQTIQIRVRGLNKTETFDKIRELSRFLFKLGTFEDTDIKVLQFIQYGDYFDMGMTQDSDLKYFEYSVNIRVPNQKKD